jgi:dTDP-4-dehydrorhamnose 3,5-epimerase
MRFVPTGIRDCVRLIAEPVADERGFFARTFCEETFAAVGIPFRTVQCAVTFSPAIFTLRGMHWQAAPSQEAKIVRVMAGRIFDVVIDLRSGSPTYLGHVGVELAGGSLDGLHVPSGCAHGFLTLEPDTEVLYQMSDVHRPELARGVRFDDPLFAIAWPAMPQVILARDATYPDHQSEVG